MITNPIIFMKSNNSHKAYANTNTRGGNAVKKLLSSVQIFRSALFSGSIGLVVVSAPNVRFTVFIPAQTTT